VPPNIAGGVNGSPLIAGPGRTEMLDGALARRSDARMTGDWDRVPLPGAQRPSLNVAAGPVGVF
jgi:hypothetical protein